MSKYSVNNMKSIHWILTAAGLLLIAASFYFVYAGTQHGPTITIILSLLALGGLLIIIGMIKNPKAQKLKTDDFQIGPKIEHIESLPSQKRKDKINRIFLIPSAFLFLQSTVCISYMLTNYWGASDILSRFFGDPLAPFLLLTSIVFAISGVLLLRTTKLGGILAIAAWTLLLGNWVVIIPTPAQLQPEFIYTPWAGIVYIPFVFRYWKFLKPLRNPIENK